MLAGYHHLLAAGRRLQWDEADIDLSRDPEALAALDADTQAHIRGLVAGFWVAEHGVAEHLMPFLAASDGPLREALALQATDEHRHASFFARAWTVLGAGADPRSAAAPEIVRLFESELPEAARALAAGETAVPAAAALYHLVLEAIVLAVGELALLEDAAALPGLTAGATRVQADERWHVGLGVQLLADAGAVPDAAAVAAERAARAWGPAVATPARVTWAIATDLRRRAVLARHAALPRASRADEPRHTIRTRAKHP